MSFLRWSATILWLIDIFNILAPISGGIDPLDTIFPINTMFWLFAALLGIM